jgi:hypothetical protein
VHTFVPELIIKEGATVVVLDDDSSIHQIWTGRFEKLLNPSYGIELKHFSTAQELIDWTKSQTDLNQSLYLIDFELIGDSKTGLDVIEDLGIGKASILVTSRFEEDQIRIRCQKAGVRFIPKGLAAFVPIVLSKKTVTLSTQAVLIDDSPLNRMSWELYAKRSGINLMTFATSDEMLNVVSQLDLATPLFFDSELAEGKRGEIEAKKFYDLGFHSIYLTTGHEPEFFSNLPWIKNILGKAFPKDLFETLT